MKMYDINGKLVEVDPAAIAGLHPDDQAMLQQPPSNLSIHLRYGPTFEIDSDNDTTDEEFGSIRLLGFQDEADVQRVNLFTDDWRKDPKSALGKFPVFSRGEAGIFCMTIPVTIVRHNGMRWY